MLDPKVWWPLFPLLMLVVVVCLTWASVHVVRGSRGSRNIWLQTVALVCYLIAAAAAMGSERGLVSSDLHRPFSLIAQLAIVVILVVNWKSRDKPLLTLNAVAWAAILVDTALHFLMAHRQT